MAFERVEERMVLAVLAVLAVPGNSEQSEDTILEVRRIACQDIQDSLRVGRQGSHLALHWVLQNVVVDTEGIGMGIVVAVGRMEAEVHVKGNCAAVALC